MTEQKQVKSQGVFLVCRYTSPCVYVPYKVLVVHKENAKSLKQKAETINSPINTATDKDIWVYIPDKQVF